MTPRNAALSATAVLLGLLACTLGDVTPVDARELSGTPDSPRLTVSTVGLHTDPRAPIVREALREWNAEFARLGVQVRFDTVPAQVLAFKAGGVLERIPEADLRAASRWQRYPWAFLANGRLRRALLPVPGEVVIVLSNEPSLISFGVPFENHAQVGVVGLRPMTSPPLSLPNVAINVVMHELGHVLGLEHTSDPATLMCGRPASCRPRDFASSRPRIFPLTSHEKERLKTRWP